MKDSYGREIDYMRVSITDLCNLRCRYCMPDGAVKLSHNDILRYEEIEEVIRAAAQEGITRIKVTGGEPLVRRGAVDFIRRVKAIPGIEQVTLTSNGILLGENAEKLAQAGLSAVNVSLDTLREDVFQQITGSPDLKKVRQGIEAALAAGLRVKINVVPQKDVNEDELTELAEYAHLSGKNGSPVDVRFIEMMPIGMGKASRGVSGDDVFRRLEERFGRLTPDHTKHGNGPARYYKARGFEGSFGFISPVSHSFCKDCSRLRLTSRGFLKSCLCYPVGVDLLPVLRGEGYCSDGHMQPSLETFIPYADAGEGRKSRQDLIRELIRRAAFIKPYENCFGKEEVSEVKSMYQIGG